MGSDIPKRLYGFCMGILDGTNDGATFTLCDAGGHVE